MTVFWKRFRLVGYILLTVFALVLFVMTANAPEPSSTTVAAPPPADDSGYRNLK